MSWLGPAIGAAGSLLGGLFGRRDDRRARAREERWNQQSQRNYETQIQTRVKDAKAAGIHPLYALGSPGIGATFSTSPSTSASGSHIANAANALSRGAPGRRNPLQDRLVEAQIKAAESAAFRDEAAATAQLSAEARARQAAVSTGHDHLGVARPGDFVQLGRAAVRAAVPDRYKGRSKAVPLIPKLKQDEKPPGLVLNSLFPGLAWKDDPRSTSGEAGEQLLGEPGSWPYSVLKVLDSLGYNAKRFSRWLKKRNHPNTYYRRGR